MTLPQAYAILAAVLALAALLLGLDAGVLRSFRRSPLATYVLGLAAVALLGRGLWTLPVPDLAGFPRLPVTIVFVLGGLAAFVWMPDLLAVRALGSLMLFLARATLDAGWMRLPDSLLCASVSYALLVVPGLWWASSPGAFVRHADWVAATPARRLSLAGLLAILACACALAASRVPA